MWPVSSKRRKTLQQSPTTITTHNIIISRAWNSITENIIIHGGNWNLDVCQNSAEWS
jgi:hypothetical protein